MKMTSLSLITYITVFSIYIVSLSTSDRGDVPSAEGLHCPQTDTCPNCLVCAEACSVKHGYCWIENQCIASGSSNPNDKNQICRPLISMLTWTEEYENKLEKGIILEMNLKDKVKMEDNSHVICDGLKIQATSFCRNPDNEAVCVSELCALIGVDKSTTDMTRPMNINLRKCWIEPYYDYTKWRFYAKMALRRYDIEEYCLGYHAGSDDTNIYWLLPNCILQPVVKVIEDKWEKTLQIDIKNITGYCDKPIEGTKTPTQSADGYADTDPGTDPVDVKEKKTKMSAVYWALIALAGILVILLAVITIICVRRKKQSQHETPASPPRYTEADNVTFNDTYMEPASISRPGVPEFPATSAATAPPPYSSPDHDSNWVSHMDGIPLKE